jgi:predicted dehydrogenase
MLENNIQIGFVGAGGIAKSHHLPNLLKISGVKLIAVANRSESSARQVAEIFGFQKVYTNWKDVVDDPDVHIVFVCTPPYMHKEICNYALGKGKHVFCQARMAMDLSDALEMLAADDQSGLSTMLCPPPHYLPAESFVLNMMEQGDLGEIRHVVLTHPSSSLLDPEQPLHWRQRKDLQGINLLDVGIMGEVLQKWFGPIKRINAMGKTWVTERPADKDGKTAVKLPDSVTLSGQFATDVTLTALFSGSVDGGMNQLTIHGTKATITCYQGKSFIMKRDSSGEKIIDIPAEAIGSWQVEKDFLDAVRTGRKGSPSFREGARYMAFTQAVMDSIHSGQTVEIQQIALCT